MMPRDGFAGIPAAEDLRTIRWKLSAAREWGKLPGCKNCCATSAKTDLNITWPRIFLRWRPRFTKRLRGISVGRCTRTLDNFYFSFAGSEHKVHGHRSWS